MSAILFWDTVYTIGLPALLHDIDYDFLLNVSFASYSIKQLTYLLSN